MNEIGFLIGLIIGFVFGGSTGFLLAAMMAVVKNADEHSEKYLEEIKIKNT